MTTLIQQPGPVLFLEWDTLAIIQHQAAFLVETGDAANDDEAFRRACEARDLFEFEWDSLIYQLTEQLNLMNAQGYWQAEVSNFGWQKSHGYAAFYADNGRDLLAKILPKTDCTFRIYIANERTLKIQNFHHDSPVGNEWYILSPLSRAQY